MIREQKKGITYGDVNVSILLYADDIVLLSNCEEGLLSMLVMLGEWCSKWGLTINGNKSKVMHFRSQSVDKTVFLFTCRDETLEIISQYKYIGLILTEHLDFLEMAKSVAKSANRALGFLICKDKAMGGMPFKCFTKCYNSLVQPIIDYGSPVWGTNGYSCVETVQDRACRYFFGLKNMLLPLQFSETWDCLAPRHKQWLCVMKKMAQGVIHGQLLSN